ncbi:MAG: (Fe-S)-binding protein [Desulfobacteraceae bacterium]|nr:(Fe-S)-binding protein [Desulfobacteraceae bacterium]
MKSEEVRNCGKCGLCLMACPVYREVLSESASPRGKIQLIKHYAEKNLLASLNLREIVSRCLMCGNCTANCPSGVHHDSLFMRMRFQMNEDFGEGWIKKAMFHFLSHEDQLRVASRFARLGRNTALDVKLGNIPIKNLPVFNKKPFRDQVSEVIEPGQEARGTVLYFTGCATNYLYEDVGNAVVRVLCRMGYRVEIPRDQVCCGLPMFFQGAVEKAESNVLKNISLFDRSDILGIVVDCATCGSALRRGYAAVLSELGIDNERAERVAEKVKDISEFVYENFAALEPFLRKTGREIRVTYHSPCHLRNAQAQTEQLLESLPGVDYARAADADLCCGGGGTFFYDYPDISRSLVEKKIKNAVSTRARFWATGCPGCRVNLTGNLDTGNNLDVLHPVQLVEMSM